MSTTKVDLTIRPGDLVEVEAWAYNEVSDHETGRTTNIAVVTKMSDDNVFGDGDRIIHLLFIGQSAVSMAMLSRLKRLNS